MTIQALEIIHDLLKREVQALKVDYQQACDAEAELEFDDPARPAYEEARKKAYSMYSDVRDALCDFTSHDWH